MENRWEIRAQVKAVSTHLNTPDLGKLRPLFKTLFVWVIKCPILTEFHDIKVHFPLLTIVYAGHAHKIFSTFFFFVF